MSKRHDVLSPGDRVTATLYGTPRIGTVINQSRDGAIVFVHWDGNARTTWAHLASLAIAKVSDTERAQ